MSKAIPIPVKDKNPEAHVEKATNGFVVSKGCTYDGTRKTILCKDEKEAAAALKKIFTK